MGSCKSKAEYEIAKSVPISPCNQNLLQVGLQIWLYSRAEYEIAKSVPISPCNQNLLQVGLQIWLYKTW